MDRGMRKNITKKKPLVSIVMPVYNAGRFLKEAIESILNQTYKNFELVIVDDKSTDNSWEIIKQYQDLYPQTIKAVSLKKNTNAAGNGGVNAVYKTLKGKYIARMDADDIAEPTRIEKQVDFMEKHPEAILLGTQGLIINEFGKVIGKKIFPLNPDDIYKEFFVFHPLLHPSVMIRKSLVPQKEYLYEDKYGVNGEYYTFFKLLKYGQFYNLNEYLIRYRLHKNNFSLQNPKEKFINSLKIRYQAVRKLGYRPTLKSLILMFIQTIVVFSIPEKFIIPLYYLIKGIKIPKYILCSSSKKLSINIGQLS